MSKIASVGQIPFLYDTVLKQIINDNYITYIMLNNETIIVSRLNQIVYDCTHFLLFLFGCLLCYTLSLGNKGIENKQKKTIINNNKLSRFCKPAKQQPPTESICY